MTKLGILQLPYNPAGLLQLLEQLAKFDGQVLFIEMQARIDNYRPPVLPENIHFVSCPSYDVETLVDLARSLELDNLLSFAELGLIPAAQVREVLGMPGHDAATEINTVDKYRMRIRLRDAHLTRVCNASCQAQDLVDTLNSFGLPAVVKPAALTGSIGVQLLETPNDVPGYLERLQANSYAKGCDLVVENFIPGAEYSVEGLLLDGTIHLYGITEKQTTEVPYFVEVGHRFDANHPLLTLLHPTLQAIFPVLGMTLCPFHIEFKIIDQRVEIIEIHSRFGGDFITRLMEYSLGNEVFLEYVEYLMHGSVPCVNRQAATVTAIGFASVPAGVVRSVSAPPQNEAIELLESKIAVKAGDVISPQTGFYDRPAYFISRLKDERAAQAFERFMNGFTIELATEDQE